MSRHQSDSFEPARRTMKRNSNSKCSTGLTSGGKSQWAEEERFPDSSRVARNSLAFLFCAIYMLVGSITTARAQAPGTGAIAGVVLDSSGAAVSNAQVSLVNE